MPAVANPGGATGWPAEQGTLGVVGVAPWATLDFLRALYARVPAVKDWHYPRVIADVNTKLPSRGRHLELGEVDPSPLIAQTVAELAAQGATVVVVPCNTAHLLYDRWAANSPVPLPHIVEHTARELAVGGARRAVALSSRALRRSGLYERCFADHGLQPVALHEAGADLVAQAIEAVKRAGRVGDALEQQLAALLRDLARDGVDGVALGCTELAALLPLCRDAGLLAVDSNEALAVAALRLLDPTPN